MARIGETTFQHLQLQMVANHPIHTQKQMEQEITVVAISWWQVTRWRHHSIPPACYTRWHRNHQVLTPQHLRHHSHAVLAAATHLSSCPAFSIMRVQDGPKASSTSGCRCDLYFVGPETLSVCAGLHRGAQWAANPHRTPLPAFKLSTPRLKPATTVIWKYHKLLYFWCHSCFLPHSCMLLHEPYTMTSRRGARSRLHLDNWCFYYVRFPNRKMGFGALV